MSSPTGGPAGGPTRGADTPRLTDTRRGEVDRWLAANRDAQGGIWPFRDSRAGDRIGSALKGNSDLGRLNAVERDYLATQATAIFSHGNHAEAIRETADAVRGDRAASAALAKAYAAPAASDEAIYAKGGTTIGTSEGGTARADLLRAAVLLDPAAATTAFAGNEAALAKRALNGMSTEAVTGLMRAAADRRIPIEAADRLVSASFVHVKESNLRNPGLRGAMADALAMISRPGTGPADQSARTLMSDRLEGIMSTDGGRALLFDADIRPELRAWAFGKVMQTPGWTVDTLRDGWESDVITSAFAAKNSARFAPLGSDGMPVSALVETSGNRTVAKDALRNTVGQALGLAPDQLPSDKESGAARDARLRAGVDHRYYGDESHASRVANVIARESDSGARVSVIPITVTNDKVGALTTVVFRIDRGDGGVRFVDNLGQRYDNLDHWKKANELPPGRMVIPEGLRPGAGLAAPENTRLVADTFGEWAGRTLDGVALGVGIVAGVAVVIGSGGTAAIVAAGAAGAYTAGRSGQELYEENRRGVDVLDFSNPENRSRWLDIAAGTLSLGAISGGLRLAGAASRGATVPVQLSRGVAGMTVAADVLDGVAMADQSIQLSLNWSGLSNADRAMGLLNVAFWGGMMAASTRSSGAGLNEAFSFTGLDNSLRTGTPYPMSQGAGLTPGEIRVAYDIGPNGRATNLRIETGPGAIDRAQLDLHTATARQIEAAGGLSDQLGRLLGGRTPEVGSAGWEARLEIDKIGREARMIATELADPSLTPARRGELETRRRELDQALGRESERLAAAAADANGFVAAPRSLDQLLEFYARPRPDGRSADITLSVPESLPRLATPAANARPRVRLGELNDLRQATGIEAIITRASLDTGSKADGSIRDLPGWEGGAANHSRGHLLARMLGGSGSDRRNLVTMFQRNTNSPVMRDFEKVVYDAVKAGEVVSYRVTPLYDGAGMPYAIAMQARGSDGLAIDITIANQDGR